MRPLNTKETQRTENIFGPSVFVHNFFAYNLFPLRGCTRVWVNVISLGVALSIVGYAVTSSTLEECYFFFFAALEYSIIVIQCAFRHTPFSYLGPVSTDGTSRLEKSGHLKLNKLHSLLTFLVLVLKCLFIVSCSNSKNIQFYIMPSALAEHYIISGADIFHITQIVYFTSVYFRAQLLKENILKSFFRVRLRSNSRKTSSQTPLVLYRGFMDEVTAAAPQVDNMLVLSFFCSFLKTLHLLYDCIWNFSKYLDSYNFMMIVRTIMHLVFWIMPYVPAVINEVTSYQLDRLKLTLMNQLINCEYEDRRRELKTLVQYMTTRRFNYRVWRFIPVDVSLLVALFSLLSTYLIVAVQFSHQCSHITSPVPRPGLNTSAP